tara:strand:- start:371 stop:925 length:555 start_codon:yes stop_codon:yes gene_type:complete
MSNHDLSKGEIRWLMEELAKEMSPVRENCGHDLEPYSPKVHGGLTKDPESGMTVANGNIDITGEPDHEVSMASSQLDKAARYAQSMSSRMEQMGEQNLPAWVQAKITKASDYISNVYHYMDKYLGEDTGMISEDAEGKIRKTSHEIEIDVSISKSDMKALHDGKSISLSDVTDNNNFKVNIKSD